MAARPAQPSSRPGVRNAVERTWSGRGLASTALLPASWLFGGVASLRRGLFERGVLTTNRLPVPVVVVGNLVAGGAGKTPTTMAIVEILRRAGYTPGIVSRGYGRSNTAICAVDDRSNAALVGDEPLLMHRRTLAPVFVGRDRVAAAHALLHTAPDVNIIVSDDGLQHLALDRDVEVLVFDERGTGNGRLLPAGPLRERLPSVAGARQIVLYNALSRTTPWAGFLATRAFAGISPLAAWWRGEAPERDTLASLRGRDLLAVAGLARPDRFFNMLRAEGLAIRELPLDDHHDFEQLPWPSSTADVIVTEKDAVKLLPTRPTNARVWVAALDFTPETAFGVELLSMLPAPVHTTVLSSAT